MSKIEKSKIDILLMSDNGLETVGGEQESTKIIINGIKDDYALGIIQPGRINTPVDGVRYYNLTRHTRIKHLIKNPFLFIKYFWNVKKVIVKERPKVIHTQAQVSFFIVALMKKFKLISKNIYFIHTERGLYTKYSRFFKKLFLFFMKELDVLVTTTNLNLKYWKNILTEKKISVDYKVIENTAGQLFESFDEKLKKNNSNVLTIGFAGRYTNWKNWPLAVEIIEKLNEKIGERLQVKMAVGCLDKKAERETQKMFEKLSKLLGNRFNGKINLDLKEMEKFYYSIDVFILTSQYNTESFGRTLVEAMSRKTVVLTTNAGGAVEVVGNDENVLENTNEFVEKILFFYFNQDLMNKEKERNFIRVNEKYSLSNNIIKHKELYSKIIDLERDML